MTSYQQVRKQSRLTINEKRSKHFRLAFGLILLQQNKNQSKTKKKKDKKSNLKEKKQVDSIVVE